MRCFPSFFTFIILFVTFGAAAVRSQPITAAPDGTGTIVNQRANQINITGGTQAGTNLFHSFEQFGLNQGQSANFLSNPNIVNILGRVTGGNASLINGLIQVTGGNSNLFLINPAGIVLGTHARLNVPASFTATTAQAIGMGNHWFNAIGSNHYAALTATPNSFAFLSQPGSILNAGTLSVGQGQSVTLLGGTVINTGTITAPGGTITVAAVPGEKVVRLSQEGSLLSLELPLQQRTRISPATVAPLSLPQLLTGAARNVATGVTVDNGVVKLTAANTPIAPDAGTAIVSGTLTTAAATPSTIQVLGQQVGVVSATVDASGTNGGGTILIGGDYLGQGTTPTARSTDISAGSMLKADALTSGNGGRVIVWADEDTRFAGTISAKGGAQSGNGGFVETSGKQTLVVEGGRVSASAANGQAGTWLLDPRDIRIANSGGTITPGTITASLNSGTNVTLTTSQVGADAGDITLADSIDQTGGGAASLTLTGRRFATENNATIAMTSSGGLTFNLNQVNPETNVATSSVQSAIDAIGAVAGTRTINLGAGTYTGATLSIGKSLTLNGAGASRTILSGENVRQVMNVSGGNDDVTVTLNGLTISGGNAGSGGGIYNFSATVTVSNSALSGNSAERGGGIYNNLFGTVTVSNSALSGNSAGLGGGIYNLVGMLTVSNSTFSGNSTESDGGAIYNNLGGVVTVSNSTLSGNSADERGGGVFNSMGRVTVTNSTLSGNVAKWFGGGIHNELGTMTVTNSTLSGNSAGLRGGGISNIGRFSDIGTMTVSNSILSGNSAELGGGIYTDGGTMTVSNSTLSRNSAELGGGIYNSTGTMTVSNSTLSGNSSKAEGGGIFNGSGTMTVSNSTVSDNSAEQGGGISNTGGTVTVSNSTVSDNSAEQGGGIYNDGGTMTVTNSTLSGNAAKVAGGGISNNIGTMTVTNSTLSGNAAKVAGGGIINSETMTVTNSTLSGNSAGVGGGIASSGRMTVTNSTLSGNSAGVSGGGIANSGRMTVTNSTLSGNSARVSGGGIYTEIGTMTVTNSTLSGNSAGVSGGGIYDFIEIPIEEIPIEEIPIEEIPIEDVFVGTIEIGSSIISGNIAPEGREVFGTFTSNGYNLFGYSSSSGLSDNSYLSPLDIVPSVALSRILAPLGNYGGTTKTHALLPGSPAINTGDFSITTADQRGVSPVGDRDIGAYESAGFSLVATSGTPQSTTITTTFATPLSFTITETAFNRPLPGATIALLAPKTGASATFNTFDANTITTDASGQATFLATANGIPGEYKIGIELLPSEEKLGEFTLTNKEPSFLPLMERDLQGRAVQQTEVKPAATGAVLCAIRSATVDRLDEYQGLPACK